MSKKQKVLKFPKGFLWGATTSSHQIEGGQNNTWSKWEKSAKRIASLKKQNKNPDEYISGTACDSWNRFDEDLECLKKINANAYRFSIEWSRIESEEGKFKQEAIDRYKSWVKKLRQNNIEPFVTLFHWPVPLWLEEKGSWLSKKSVFYFTRYACKMAKELSEVKFWTTINEPMIYSSHSYLKGGWPPNKKNIFSYIKVINNLISAHIKSYEAIKKIDSKPQIGIAKHNIYFQAYKKRIWNIILGKAINWFWESYILNKIKNHQDFIGLNYYCRNRIKRAKFKQNVNKRTTDMGWEIYPKGIYFELLDLKKHNKPIYITENGLADTRDKERKKFIIDHLKYIHRALGDGVDVRGYLHWSLLDNFEWAEGFWPKFGLFEVDRKNNFQRSPRPSAAVYGKIAKENKVVLQ